MRQGTMGTARTYETAQRSAYYGEHIMAYLFAGISLVLGAAGLLEGFRVFNLVEGGEVTAGQPANDFLDGIFFIIPAASAALLSLYFHTSDHHRLDLGSIANQDKAAWSAEHGGAMLMGLGGIGLIVIGLLVGFDVIGTREPVENGTLWMAASLIPATLSVTLHQVRHHQIASEDDHIREIVDEHVAVPHTHGTTPA